MRFACLFAQCLNQIRPKRAPALVTAHHTRAQYRIGRMPLQTACTHKMSLRVARAKKRATFFREIGSRQRRGNQKVDKLPVGAVNRFEFQLHGRSHCRSAR